MEEVLQRVQFKFASIIGELCSEPLVLSQFAIWVDMRLSEFKLKGSISLDCSGETPDPIWLKGITHALNQKLKQAQKEAADNLSLGKGISPDGVIRPRAGGGRPSLPESIPGRNNIGNLDSSFTDHSQEVIVKEEPGDDSDVYPVDLYANHEKPTNSSVCGAKRKMPSSAASHFQSNDTVTDISESVHKIRRLPLPEEAAVDTEREHTSLLSIIGLEDTSAEGPSELTLHEADSDDISIILDSSTFQGTSSQSDNNSISLSQPSSQTNIGNAPLQSMATMDGSNTRPWIHHQYRPALPFRKGSDAVPNMKSHQQIAYQLRQMRSYVKKFERWASLPPRGETRKIEKIPPAELNGYLTTFFATVKRDTGGEYGYQSLITLRAGLERHLKQHSYPCSLRESQEFMSSQKALKSRKYHRPALSASEVDLIAHDVASSMLNQTCNSDNQTSANTASQLDTNVTNNTLKQTYITSGNQNQPAAACDLTSDVSNYNVLLNQGNHNDSGDSLISTLVE